MGGKSPTLKTKPSQNRGKNSYVKSWEDKKTPVDCDPWERGSNFPPLPSGWCPWTDKVNHSLPEHKWTQEAVLRRPISAQLLMCHVTDENGVNWLDLWWLAEFGIEDGRSSRLLHLIGPYDYYFAGITENSSDPTCVKKSAWLLQPYTMCRPHKPQKCYINKKTHIIINTKLARYNFLNHFKNKNLLFKA